MRNVEVVNGLLPLSGSGAQSPISTDATGGQAE